MKLHLIPSDCTEIEWRKAADTVYMIARASSKAQGIPSHVLEAQRDVLHAAFVKPAAEHPSPLGVQFGASDSADFSAGTWVFTMHNDWKVAAGEFAIMPREMYHRLFNQAARPTAPAGQLGAWLEIDDIDELADRYGDHDQKNDCYSFNREGPHSVRSLVAEVMRRCPSTSAAPAGYVIAHVDGKRWRTLDSLGMPDWTDDITKALCVTLAEHAHAYAAEDPEDVRILPRGLPELHPTLVESVGQAIYDEIVENGAEDLDWHDSREVDRVARAAVKAMRRFLDSISQPREVDARNSLLEEIADARDNLMNVGHHDDAVAAMGKALNWIEGEPSTEPDDGGRPAAALRDPCPNEYRISADGGAWCATRAGFRNLQEGEAGFGDSPLAALGALITAESEVEARRCEAIRDWKCNCCQTLFSRSAPKDTAPPCPCCKSGDQYVFERKAAFGHHPDPAIDFTCEVDAIEAEITDRAAGLPATMDLGQRIERAMQFKVGGDTKAISAKHDLRKIEAAFKARERACRG